MSISQDDSLRHPAPVDISAASLPPSGAEGAEPGNGDDVSSLSTDQRRSSSEEPEDSFDDELDDKYQMAMEERVLDEEEEQALFNHMFCWHPKLSHESLYHIPQMLQPHPYFPNIPHRHVSVKSNLTDQTPLFKDNLRIIQEISAHKEGGIWCMKFSPTGRFLCTAGEDANVIVWCVADYPHEAVFWDQVTEGVLPVRDSSFLPPLNPHGISDFLHTNPLRVLSGHEDQVIDVAWSKSEFILSASLDRTVRLWHVSSTECLQKFLHDDIVTAVDFHPHHDRYFVSGCWDRKVRIWDILPEGTCLEVTEARETITSVCFNPEGKLVVVGLIKGKVSFYDMPEFDSLKFKTEMDCRNKSGKYKRGTKVTGVCYQPIFSQLPAATAGTTSAEPQAMNNMWSNRLLVTTNDSRVRLCRVDDYTMEKKYKGVHNKSMQIKSSFSQSGSHHICGSEDGKVVIWNYASDGNSMWDSCLRRGSNRTREVERFRNLTHVPTTAAIFVPAESVTSFLTMNSHIIQKADLLPGRDSLAVLSDGRGSSRDTIAARAANADRAVMAARMIRQLSTNSTKHMSADAQRDLRNSMSNEGDLDEDDNGAGILRNPVGVGRGRAESVESGSATAVDAIEIQRARRINNYCTRFIVTADRAGYLRVYVRIGNTDLDSGPQRKDSTLRMGKESSSNNEAVK